MQSNEFTQIETTITQSDTTYNLLHLTEKLRLTAGNLLQSCYSFPGEKDPALLLHVYDQGKLYTEMILDYLHILQDELQRLP